MPAEHSWPLKIKLDVAVCPRCAGGHQTLEFRRFELGDATYTHWSYCPATGEPLLYSMKSPEKRKPDKFSVQWMPMGNGISPVPDRLLPDNKAPVGVGVCNAPVPYPAKGKGLWKVYCTECGGASACAAFGNPLDPRTVTIVCKRKEARTMVANESNPNPETK